MNRNGALDLTDRTTIEDYHSRLSSALKYLKNPPEIATVEAKIAEREQQLATWKSEGDVTDGAQFRKAEEAQRHLTALRIRLEHLHAAQIEPVMVKMTNTLRRANDVVAKALAPGHKVLISRAA